MSDLAGVKPQGVVPRLESLNACGRIGRQVEGTPAPRIDDQANGAAMDLGRQWPPLAGAEVEATLGCRAQPDRTRGRERQQHQLAEWNFALELRGVRDLELDREAGLSLLSRPDR